MKRIQRFSHWWHYIDSSLYNGTAHVPMLLLNRPMDAQGQALWRKSPLRIAADGAANRTYDLTTNPPLPPPSHICGDLDSIRHTVREFYERGGAVLNDRSGDTSCTDFDKCLDWFEELLDTNQVPAGTTGDGKAGAQPDLHAENVREDLFGFERTGLVAVDPVQPGVTLDRCLVVSGVLGGRLDLQIANLNSIYLRVPYTTTPKVKPSNQQARLVFFDEHNMSFVLPPGVHTIVRNPEYESNTCGILCLSKPTDAVITRGLRWELNGLLLGLGHTNSCSNEFATEQVQLYTDTPLLWVTVRKDSAALKNVQ
eukprot:TRINITY_DN66988_c4_g3_i2.p1 TRINITY_DN66988_c4_g3~~TRINITY_DN66988_c4_g3_i2.p1  ORF type:complete len:311 (+),score=5.54 TRINITY_DN66988_c4_g3_i2:72-1004(+)